jgi:sugar phosphate isomerase/epimerase
MSKLSVMTISRRSFVKNAALATASATIFSKSLLAAGGPKPVLLTGVQLYSVRDDMKKDPLATLKKLAAMGYKYVEHANYIDRKLYGYNAKEFRKVLDDLGLSMPSGHTVLNKQHWDEGKKEFTDAWKYTVEDAAVLGQQYVISPSLDETWRREYDTLIRFMDVFNKSGELCKKAGMQFGYHNHHFEFNEKLNDTTLYDIILQRTDPKLVIQQLDIGNMYSGGGRAMEVIRKYPGRFPSMHVKDEIKSPAAAEGFESTILGQGIIETRKVVDEGIKTGGTVHLIIEQESYQGKTPIDSMKEDLEIMKKWGY